MSRQPIRPSRVWYWVAGVALVGSAVWLGLGLFLGVGSFARQVKDLQRVPIPGQAEVSFAERGGYTLYFEGTGATDEQVRIPSFKVFLESIVDGKDVPIRAYGGAQTYNVGGHAGRAVGTFHIDRPGRFFLRTTAQPQPVQADLAVGRSTAPAIFRMVGLTLAGAFSLFAAGTALAVVVAVRRNRARHAVLAPGVQTGTSVEEGGTTSSQLSRETAAVTETSHTSGQQPPPEINTAVPGSARIWNYWLGGSDNFPVDRAAGDQYREVFPGIVDVARASRNFLVRAVRYLAGEAGIRQFLDIGTGLPTANNTHQVAQGIAPESRIVYVDNDPLVFAHARALLTSTPEGATDYIDADLRDPDTILEAAAKTLDLGQPVALMLMGILGHTTDYDEARSIVRWLLAALPSGSYLALNDGTNVISKAFQEAQEGYNRSGAVPYVLRSPEQIAGFFEGLELVEPGVVSCPRWRPDPADASGGEPVDLDAFGGVGRKP